MDAGPLALRGCTFYDRTGEPEQSDDAASGGSLLLARYLPLLGANKSLRAGKRGSWAGCLRRLVLWHQGSKMPGRNHALSSGSGVGRDGPKQARRRRP